MQISHPHHSSLSEFCTELNHVLVGECDFTDAGVALYTSDASNYRQVPLGVVYPTSIDDIVAVTRLCRKHNLPVLMRGAGTSQNGQCVNKAVVIDCSRYLDKVHAIDTENRTAIIDPGIVCDALKHAAEEHGLTFGPDPATHSRCTLGGMIGNNSCGPRSMLAGKTVENVLELEILTASGDRFWVGPTSEEELANIIKQDSAQGRIYRELKSIRDQYADLIRARFPTIKRRVSGYNLDQLLPENHFNVARALVGSEGSCVTILRAKVALIENPRHRRLIVLGFDDIFTAGDSVSEIMPFTPIAMEGLDWSIIGGLKERALRLDEIALLPSGRAWLLCELAAESVATLNKQCTSFIQAMEASTRVRSVKEFLDSNDTVKIWSIREQGASATALSLNPNEPDPVVGWEDTAVDPYQLGDYLREFQALVDRYEYKTSLYGHFGDGCIHARITFDTRSKKGVEHWRRFSEEIAATVIRYGGSLSGEHGDGQAKAEFLPLMYGEDLMHAFKRFKSAWDPDNRMNPGKLIDAYKMDENLRFGPEYIRPKFAAKLHFAEDLDDFGRTSERCIGMGKCRAHTGAMCPSYQITREERFSTRGRAHLLHELLRGELIRDGWNNNAIYESLEHCLSCKACKNECPTKVDIASYKAEFMFHHYAQSRRPIGQNLFARVGLWLPKMSRFATVVNTLQNSIAARPIKKLIGLPGSQTLPALATPAFPTWAKSHCDETDHHAYWFGTKAQTRVWLWADTFSSYYRPAILRSAINILTQLGYRVGVAKQTFCCGRPLYEQGLLVQAKKQLAQIMREFYPILESDDDIIVLESSCLSVFHDELGRIYGDEKKAADLAERCKTLATFLSQRQHKPHKKLSRGILHWHCHHRALEINATDTQWMQDCFEQLDIPEQGCCGMAGSFGMRSKTRAIGQALFERRLGPAIDSLDPDAYVVTNGFSCYEQIRQQSKHTALHPVEVIERCLT